MLSALHLSLDQPGLGSLRDVSLDLCPGELLGLSGAAGSGKRLLLQVLAGRLDAREGRVLLGVQSVDTLDPFDRMRALGLLERPFDHGGEDTPLDMGMAHLTVHERPDPDIVGKALDLVGLRRDALSPLQELDTGQRRRARLASLLVQTWNLEEDHPRFLLLDRPLDGLEPDQEAEMRGVLQALGQLGWGVLVTSRRPLDGLVDRRLSLCVGRVVDPAILGI